MGTRLLLAGISLCLLVGCEPPPHQPMPRAAPQKTAARLDATPHRSQAASDQKSESNRKPEYSEEDHRLVSQKDEIVSVLKNGLVVITKRVASPVVAVRGYALTGGSFEGKWLGGGLSHLLEHLVVEGTNARRTERQNMDLLQAIGNNSDAETTDDRTVFYINTTREHMEQAVDLVTGWMFTARITPDEYRREYQVVQRELEMRNGQPETPFFEMMQMNRYRVSPARVPVIGYQPVIRGLTRDDVYNYYREAYVPNNILFVVVGDEEPEKMLDAVRKFGDYPPGRVFSHNIASEPPVSAPRAMVATFPKLGQARLNLAFPSVEQSNPDMYALDLLAAVLGQGESSILTQELRDKCHLVTGIVAEDETPSYVTGSFDVTMELDADKIPEATSVTLYILDMMKNEPVSQDRLDRARTMMRAARTQQMQRSEDIAASLGDDFMTTGDDHFSDLYLKRLDQLAPKDLLAAARKYFDRGKLLTTALFPSEFAGSAGLPKVEDVLRPAATTQEVAQKTSNESRIDRVVLDNGTVLLVKRIPTSPLVVMQMYSLGGLTAEDARTNGIGNLTMQMLLRGTKTRSAQQIAEFFDSIGGAVGAMCGNNTWAWSATSLKKNFDRAFEAYADVVNNPAFSDDQLSEMKRRVEAAIAGEDADWSAQAGRYFKKEFFGPMNSPYQFTPIGTKENVQRFTPEQLRDWYEQKVQTAPRVVAVFGDVDPDHVKELAARLLGQGPARPAPQHPKQPSALSPPGSGTPSIKVDRVAVQKTDQQLAGVIIGFKSGSVIGDPTNYTLDVIDTLTSGFTYPTGYIFETLRGLGLVYVADAHNVPGRDATLPGMFEEYAGCDPANVNQVVELMLENTARVEGSPQDVNMDWYKRAKELMIVADAMENETPSAQAQIAAVDEVLGLGYDYHRQFADQVRQVQLSQVQSVSRQRLRECVLTISTPRPDLVQIKPGMRSWTSFPPVDLAPKGVQHDVGSAGK